MTLQPRLITPLVISSLLLMTLSASAQDLRDGVEQLAQKIMQAAPEGRQLRIAVVDFPDLVNVTSSLGRYVANRLTTRLAQNPQFFMVERQRLGQVLEELKFSMSDVMNPEKAKRLGQVVGVEAIVVGTISDLGNQVDLDARVIEIETSRMVVSATSTISKDQVVNQLLQQGRESATLLSPAGAQPNRQSQQSVAYSDARSSAVAKVLKESAASLAARSGKGTRSSGTAGGWIAEYNRLIQESQSVLKQDAYIQALQRFVYFGDNAQASTGVATAAKGLEVYLTSFSPHTAFGTSAALLATRAAESTKSTATAKGWVAEYNILIQEAKAVFPEDKFIQALQPLKYSGNNNQTAGMVAAAARKLQRIMGVEQQR